MTNKRPSIQIKNPAFNYDQLGGSYSKIRQTDPRIAELVHSRLSGASTIINVGAGTGSYEPEEKFVVAIEPSSTMRAQRLANGKVPAINATAASIPFDDNSFDAAMAMVTIHHWPDIEKGLAEIRRVTKGRMLILTFDPDALDGFWTAEYFPELIEVEKIRFPAIESIVNLLGKKCDIIKVPVPSDCTDGFQEAYYARPESFLNPEVRMNQSAWGFLPPELQNELVNRLADELKTGKWDEKYGHYRTLKQFTGALRLIVTND